MIMEEEVISQVIKSDLMEGFDCWERDIELDFVFSGKQVLDASLFVTITAADVSKPKGYCILYWSFFIKVCCFFLGYELQKLSLEIMNAWRTMETLHLTMVIGSAIR